MSPASDQMFGPQMSQGTQTHTQGMDGAGQLSTYLEHQAQEWNNAATRSRVASRHHCVVDLPPPADHSEAHQVRE